MYKTLISLLILSVALASCKKRNGDLDQIPAPKKPPLEILKAHQWKLQENYRVDYKSGTTDTARNPIDSCPVYTVGDTLTWSGQSGYHYWMSRDGCSANSTPVWENIFYIIEDQNTLVWGVFSQYLELVQLDDYFFIHKTKYNSAISDSSVEYQVYKVIQ